MGKLTSIKTYDVFLSRYNLNQIDEKSVTFILETGQIYTHGIFINGASFGTEASGTINLTIGNTTKSLALASHTHSGYYLNTTNIDIGANKIVSGNKDLLKYDSLVKVGDTSVPLVLQGSTDITVTKGSTSYTLLDTGNFSVEEKTATGISSLNALTFKYGSNKVSVNYVRNINTSSTFDSLTGNNNLGINVLDSKTYGIITMSDMGLPLYYAQIRVNITDHAIEYRDSGSTTWKTLLTSSTVNALGVAGIVTAPSASDANKVWGTDSSGNPGWTNGGNLSASSADNITGGAAGYIPYQTGSGTTAFLTGGTNGYVLTYNAATNAPYWAQINTSDNKVSQLASSENAAYNILLKCSANSTDETQTAKYANGITINPSTNSLSIGGNLSVTGTSNFSNDISLTAGKVIKTSATSVIWRQGRDYAPLQVTSASGYSTIISIKTTDGDWSIGHYDDQDNYYKNKLLFSYVKDSDRLNNTGTAMTAILDSGGTIITSSNISSQSVDHADSISINYNNDSDASYQMLWGSSDNVYGTAGIYCNPYYDYVYAASFFTTSDIRKKTNITSISEHIRSFYFKNNPNVIQYGIIAQEVEKQHPELVDKSKEYWTVNYTSALSLYIAELENKVKDLEKRIKNLENG